MPSTRQFFINLKTDIFGSGLDKSKKTTQCFDSRTYRYSSASSRDFDHANNQRRGPVTSVSTRSSMATTSSSSSIRTTSSTSSTRSTSSRVSSAPKPIRATPQRRQQNLHTSTIPGSWPEEKIKTYHEPTQRQSYQRVQHDPQPTYNKVQYPVVTPTPIVRGRNTVYIKPMTISNEPMGTRRHIRSGSDVLIVHHPTPQDLDEY